MTADYVFKLPILHSTSFCAHYKECVHKEMQSRWRW